ncbi:hypothetical protein FB446DRAFT_804882 [Lentinula raphanica]|nr:hypothetical protein FB446DRAFT_804882 [Lentinula raphanica]
MQYKPVMEPQFSDDDDLSDSMPSDSESLPIPLPEPESEETELDRFLKNSLEITPKTTVWLYSELEADSMSIFKLEKVKSVVVVGTTESPRKTPPPQTSQMKPNNGPFNFRLFLVIEQESLPTGHKETKLEGKTEVEVDKVKTERTSVYEADAKGDKTGEEICQLLFRDHKMHQYEFGNGDSSLHWCAEVIKKLTSTEIIKPDSYDNFEMWEEEQHETHGSVKWPAPRLCGTFYRV